MVTTRDRSHIGNGLLGCTVLFGLQVLSKVFTPCNPLCHSLSSISVSLPTVLSNRHQLSSLQMWIFVSKIIFGIIGNYVYYEITSSSSSSLSLLRFLRSFGLFTGANQDYGGGRTPAMSASYYNIANISATGATPSQQRSDQEKKSD